MSNGIYYYEDNKTNNIVYIGKDSYIDEGRRDKAHRSTCNYDKQKINQIIQSNPDRYEYGELIRGDFKEYELNNLEISYISSFNPRFNYNKGGTNTGQEHLTEEHKQLLSDKTKERWINGVYDDVDFKGMTGKTHSDETKKRMSESRKGFGNANCKWDVIVNAGGFDFLKECKDKGYSRKRVSTILNISEDVIYNFLRVNYGLNWRSL